MIYIMAEKCMQVASPPATYNLSCYDIRSLAARMFLGTGKNAPKGGRTNPEFSTLSFK